MTRSLLVGICMIAALVACGKKDDTSASMEKATADASASEESAKSAVSKASDTTQTAPPETAAKAKEHATHANTHPTDTGHQANTPARPEAVPTQDSTGHADQPT